MAQFTSSTVGKYSGYWLVGTALFELALAGLFVFLSFHGAAAASQGFLLTAAILGFVGIILALIGVRALRAAADAQRVSEVGVAGTAVVTAVTQTGVYINQNPQLEMTLSVNVPGRPAYTAERKEVVPMILLSRVGVGATLPVKIDPQNQADVVIQWDQ